MRGSGKLRGNERFGQEKQEPHEHPTYGKEKGKGLLIPGIGGVPIKLKFD